MSANNSEGFVSENNPQTVQIGELTYTNIAMFGYKPQGVDGGDAVTSHSVLGRTVPSGVTHHTKETIITVVIDSKECMRDLTAYARGYWKHDGNNNGFIFKVTLKDDAGKIQTLSFGGSTQTVDGTKNWIQSIEPKQDNENKHLTEIKILSHDAFWISAFLTS